MKTIAFNSMLILFFISFLCNAQEANTIMQRYQENAEIDFLTSEIEYNNHSKKGRVQNRKLKQFIKRQKETKDCYKLLLRFEEPGDVRGTSTLTIQNSLKNDQQWLYLPALRNTKQISPSRKTNRFMGTEMTYEDLNNYLSEPLNAHQYKLLREEKLNKKACYVIEAIPTLEEEQKNSGYSKRLLWIDKNDYSNLKTIFYDKSGNELKVYEAFEIKVIDDSNHLRPHRITMKNLKTGNWTEVKYSNISINKAIEDNLFTVAYMENN